MAVFVSELVEAAVQVLAADEPAVNHCSARESPKGVTFLEWSWEAEVVRFIGL